MDAGKDVVERLVGMIREQERISVRQEDKIKGLAAEVEEQEKAAAQAVCQLRSAREMTTGRGHQRIGNAIRILTGEEEEGKATEEGGPLLEQIRRELGVGTSAGIIGAIRALMEAGREEAQRKGHEEGEDPVVERVDRYRELAGCAPGEMLAERINALVASADGWEAEAKERAESQTQLEDRMDEARMILEQYAAVFTPAAEEIRQAIAMLGREQGREDPPPEAVEGGSATTLQGAEEERDRALERAARAEATASRLARSMGEAAGQLQRCLDTGRPSIHETRMVIGLLVRGGARQGAQGRREVGGDGQPAGRDDG